MSNVEGPDQPFGWVIAFACFWINFVMAGLARTAGVLFVAIIELYGVSREAATTPFSIRVCVRNLTGPLIGLLGLKYGIRNVTTIGVFIAALGSILCYFATNIMWITIFWGGIHGMGFGLSTVIHMMTIGQYFDKYKASALGLGYSGDCFGTFVFPVIMEHLLASYGLRGTFLILGGIVLNVVPMALLLRKPSWLKNKKKKGNFSKNIMQKIAADNNIQNRNFHPGYQNDAFLKLDEDLSFNNDDAVDQHNSSKSVFQFDDDPPEYHDLVRTNCQINDLKSKESSVREGLIRSLRNPSEVSELMRENVPRHDSLPPVFENKIQVEGNNQQAISSIAWDNQSSNTEPETDGDVQVQNSTIPRKRNSSFIGQIAHDIVSKMRSASFASQVAQDGFIGNLQEPAYDGEKETSVQQQDQTTQQDKQNGPMIDTFNLCNNIAEKELVISANNLNKFLDERKTSHISIQIEGPKKSTIFQTLLRTNIKPIFILISISMAVYAFLFVGVFTIIIDYAVDQGVNHEHGKYLVIGFSVTDLFGRLSFGQIIDRKLLKMKNYSGMTMLLMGTLVAIIPLNNSFYYMMSCMCLYGLVQGGTAIMFPILVSHYMDKNEESVAMGCLNFYGGLLMLGLAPMIGYFRDNTGSYNWVFHILGGMVLVVGLVWQLEPLILKLQKKQTSEPEDTKL